MWIWPNFGSYKESVSMDDNSFRIAYMFESLQPWGCSWRGYATQEADQELKWKLRTISVWENWVLEFLGSHSWDTRGGSPREGQYLKKPGWIRVKWPWVFTCTPPDYQTFLPPYIKWTTNVESDIFVVKHLSPSSWLGKANTLMELFIYILKKVNSKFPKFYS